MKAHSSIILTCLALLAGCSTLSEQECRSADWHRIGAKDGRNGELASLLEEHRDSCKSYGIRPNEEQYLAGRNAGLTEYCQPGNAFRTGLNGEEYKGVCPPESDMQFRRYNAAALEVYNSKRRLGEIEDKLSREERELEKKGITEKEKLHILEEIRELDRKRDRLRSDLNYQERELDRLMDETKERNGQSRRH